MRLKSDSSKQKLVGVSQLSSFNDLENKHKEALPRSASTLLFTALDSIMNSQIQTPALARSVGINSWRKHDGKYSSYGRSNNSAAAGPYRTLPHHGNSTSYQ